MNTVSKLAKNCSNALQVQYVLCHEVLADYLESFDTYANFKEVM